MDQNQKAGKRTVAVPAVAESISVTHTSINWKKRKSLSSSLTLVGLNPLLTLEDSSGIEDSIDPSNTLVFPSGFNSLPDLVSFEDLVGDGGDQDLLTLEELVGDGGYGDLISLDLGVVPHWVIYAEEAALVEDALETRPFDTSSDLARECPICMEEFAEQVEISAFPCSHIFHRGCILTWLQQRRTCPLLVYSWEELPLI